MRESIALCKIEIPPKSGHFETVTLRTSAFDKGPLIVELMEKGLIGHREEGSPDVLNDHGEGLFRILLITGNEPTRVDA